VEKLLHHRWLTFDVDQHRTVRLVSRPPRQTETERLASRRGAIVDTLDASRNPGNDSRELAIAHDAPLT
jgi:hypothetical protein